MKENLHDSMHPHNIDELFRSAIDPAEENPAPEIWDNLEKQLDQYNLVNIKRKYNNVRGIAIALALFIFSSFLYELHVWHSNDKVQTVAALHPGSSITPKHQPGLANGHINASTGLSTHNQNQQSLVTDQGDKTKNIFDPATDDDLLNHPGTLLRRNLDNMIARNQMINSFPVAGKNYSNNYRNNIGPKNAETSLTPTLPLPIDLLSGNEVQISQMIDSKNIPSNHPLLVAGRTIINDPDLAEKDDNSANPIRRKSRFSFTAIFSPDLTSRVVKSDWQINQEDNKDEIKKTEHYAFSYSFGVLADYKINRHWQIESGFTIAKAVMSIRPKFIFARRDNVGDVMYKFNSSNGYSFLSAKTFARPAFGDSLNAIGSSSSVQYVSVPVTAKYKFGKGRLHYNALAGVAANVLVRERVETSLYHGTTHETTINKDIKGLKPVYYSGIVGVGLNYDLNKKITVSLAPTARIALTSINKDAPVKSYQSSIGMVAGIQLNF